MVDHKVDFLVVLVEQNYPPSEADNSLKAGTAVTLNHSDSVTQVLHDQTVLGNVPASSQQLVHDRTPTCTVRSVKRQDGKLSQILVRAVFPSSETTATLPTGTVSVVTDPCLIRIRRM